MDPIAFCEKSRDQIAFLNLCAGPHLTVKQTVKQLELLRIGPTRHNCDQLISTRRFGFFETVDP